MITAFLIIFPMLMSVLLLGMRHKNPKWLSLGGAVIQLGVTIYTILNFIPDGGRQFGMSTIPSLGFFSFNVAIDGINLPLVLLTNALVPLIILSSYDKNFDKPSKFYGLVLMMQSALVGVFCAFDAYIFYIFWELALIPIYLICLMWGGENRGKITLKFFLYTLAGSLLMLVGMIYPLTQGVDWLGGGYDLDLFYESGQALSNTEQSWIFWAMFLAFAIKMPVFPFHTWQPDTYTVAPTQGTMLLSGIMLKMGIFGVIRWLIPFVPAGVVQWGPVALALSVIGIIYASCIAMVQGDMKRLIAYSSIAHVGLISAGVFTLSVIGLTGAILQMVSHGFVVFGLFFIVDVIWRRTGTRELSQLGGIRKAAPSFATVFIIIMLGSVALPLTSGFVGEFLLISALVDYKVWIGAVAGLTIILGAVYMLVMFQRSMSGEPNSTTSSFTDLTVSEKVVFYPVVIMILAIGIYPEPLRELSKPAVIDWFKNVVELTSSLTP